MIHEYLSNPPLTILGLKPGMVVSSVHEALQVAQRALNAVPADLYLDTADLDIEQYGENEHERYHCMLMIKQKPSRPGVEVEESGVFYLDVGEEGRVRVVSITMQSGVIGSVDWFPKILDTEFAAIRSRIGSPVAVLDQVSQWMETKNFDSDEPQIIRMDAFMSLSAGASRVFVKPQDFLTAMDEAANQASQPVLSVSMGPIQDENGRSRVFAMTKLS